MASLVPERAPTGLAVWDWSGVAKELMEWLGCLPSAGIVAVVQAIAGGAAYIRIVDMDLKPLFKRDGWHSRQAPPSFYHNFLGERRLFARLSRIARRRGMGLDAGPGLHDATPASTGRWVTGSTLEKIIAECGRQLHAALRSGPGQRHAFENAIDTCRGRMGILGSPFLCSATDVNIHLQLLDLEIQLVAPRPTDHRAHPWWLYHNDMMPAVEHLASALRTLGRGIAWSVPTDVPDALASTFHLGDLFPVAWGCEGLVFRGGRKALKWFVDPSSTSTCRPNIDQLLQSSKKANPCIPAVRRTDVISDHLAVMSDFLQTRQVDFTRTTTLDWIRFVTDCSRSRIAPRNITRENIGWANGRIVYLDLGNGLRPWNSELGEDTMRRCWLLSRHWMHPDLNHWLHGALSLEHPALMGFDAFRSACWLRIQTGNEDAPPPGSRDASSPGRNETAIPWRPGWTYRDRRKLWTSGLEVISSMPIFDPTEGPWTPPSAISHCTIPRPAARPVSVMIRCCAMDHRLVRDAIPHLSKAIDNPWPCEERIAVIDCRTSGFPRQYDNPDLQALVDQLVLFQEQGLLDRIISVQDKPAVRDQVYRRWFHAADCDYGAIEAHAENGQAILANLLGIEACAHDLILAIDIDMMMSQAGVKSHWRHDVEALLDSDAEATCISPSIPLRRTSPPTATNERGPYRPCPRVSVIARDRLRRLLPIPVMLKEGKLPAWHRTWHGLVPTRRLHATDYGFIHPDNQHDKADLEKLAAIRERIEAGIRPDIQLGSMDLTGTADWMAPKRSEDMVVVVTGRNPGPGIAKRCLDSLLDQRYQSWGCILVDDASTDGTAELLPKFLGKPERFTYISNPHRLGGLANLVRAVRNGCLRDETVIVTLDLDDALLGQHALGEIASAHCKGADLTVGSMFRRDKRFAWPPVFSCPRSPRSNVWQHLRSFRRHLFTSIPDTYLRDDSGDYFDAAWDWAYMVPICELSSHPIFIENQLYYYDCTGKTDEYRRDNKSAIDKILARPPLPRSESNHER